MSFGQSSASKANTAQLGGINTNLTGAADTAGQRAGKTFKQGEKSASLPMDFWKQVLGGDTSKIMGMFSPQIRQINQGANASQEKLNMFAPRGGGKVSESGAIERGRAGDVSQLVSSAPSMATDKLTQLAQLFFGASGGQTGAQLGALGQASGNLLTQNQQELERQQMINQLFGSLGAGAGALAGGFI